MTQYEYRVRWRRSAAFYGWKVRLFQRLQAAQKMAQFIGRDRPMMYPRDGSEWDQPYEISPARGLIIQRREVGPWETIETIRDE